MPKLNSIITLKMKHITSYAIFVIAIGIFVTLGFGTEALATSPIDWFNLGSGELAASGVPTDDPVQITLNIIKTALQILGLIVVLFIIYGGYLIMSGGGIIGLGDHAGQATQIKKGKDVIQWAIVGAVIILSSLGIVTYLDSTLFT